MSAPTSHATARAFTVAAAPARLELLAQRLATVTWPDVPDGAEGHGIPLARVQELVDHWRTRFDWTAFAEQLGAATHLLEPSGDYPLHVASYPAARPAGIPVVLLHGWPDAFVRYRKLAPLLAAAGHDVWVPSLPGFAFSGQPVGPLTVEAAAERVHTALTALGVNRYVVHGGDFGSVVADSLATAHPESVAGMHLTDVPFPKAFAVDRSTLSPDERTFFAETDAWLEQAVHVVVQAAEPLTLAYGLTDSPVGLLAWIADKFDAWSDTVDPDDVVGVTALTWLTGTTWSGFRLYADDADQDWSDEDSHDRSGTGADGAAQGGGAALVPAVPTGFSLFPRDIGRPPREYAERFYTVTQWCTHETGGHFAATERPETLARDLADFLATLPDQESGS